MSLGILVGASLALSVWYASHGLHPGRHWDERFSFRNVTRVLGGSLEPDNGFYQALSYLPQAALLKGMEALHHWTGSEALDVIQPDGTYSSASYLVCRLLQAVYGALLLVLAFVVGRRLFGPQAGLLGAFLLAVTPWHVEASAIYKPDVLVALCVLLTFWWTLRAIGEPGLRRWAVAGCGVALAASAKLTGALSALPLALGALPGARGWKERSLRLLAAGASAATLFLLLNPYAFLYPGSSPGT